MQEHMTGRWECVVIALIHLIRFFFFMGQDHHGTHHTFPVDSSGI